MFQISVQPEEIEKLNLAAFEEKSLSSIMRALISTGQSHI